MNPRKNLLTLAGLALVAVGGWATVTACTSDNVTPSNDSGVAADNTSSSSSGSSSSGGSGSSSGSSSSGGSGSSSGAGSSSGSGDAATCASDGSTCSCTTTPDMDPYNACSSYVTNCIPFDDTRVPTHPTL